MVYNGSVKLDEEYLKTLKDRGKESRVYREYQLLGLEIAQLLGDDGHKTLYIKLAKEKNGRELLRIAKEVAEKRSIKNKGAYFMRIVTKKTEK